MHTSVKISNKKEINMDDFTTFFKWIKHTTFTCQDYNACINKYKNKNVFLFIDPPYFSSYNKEYITHDKITENMDSKTGRNNDNTKMYIDILHLLQHNLKCQIMLIISSNALIDYVFKDYIIGTYEKTYQMTHKTATHNIVCNYKPK